MTALFSKKNLLWVLFAIGVFILIQVLIQMRIITPHYRFMMYWISIYIILGVSLNIIIGITGQLSLGHAGFMSIGAYSAAIMLREDPSLSGLFAGMAIGFVITLVVSFVVAMPTLKLKGDYLAIATLGVGEIIRIIILNMKITEGARGISNIPHLISWPLMFVFVVLAIIVALIIRGMIKRRKQGISVACKSCSIVKEHKSSVEIPLWVAEYKKGKTDEYDD